jgi:acid phosphatase
MENTDFDVASANPTFKKLTAKGLTLTKYFGCAHPFQENYMCSTRGNIWRLNSDDF